MTCGDCTHWNMRDATLGLHGFGWCKLEPEPFTKARQFSGQAPCNKGKFSRASQAVIDKRQQKLKGAN